MIFLQKEICKTHVIAIGSVEIIWFSQRDVRVGDNTSVMEVIETGDMRKQTVKDKDVTLLCHERSEFFAALDVIADVTRGQCWIESFRVVIQMFDDT